MPWIILLAIILIVIIAVVAVSWRRSAPGEEDDPLQARLAEFIHWPQDQWNNTDDRAQALETDKDDCIILPNMRLKQRRRPFPRYRRFVRTESHETVPVRL